MTLNITDAELHEWARMRADDAGRLARELVACRLQSQAAVAAAYEAAAQVAGNRWAARKEHAAHLYEMDYPEAKIDSKLVSGKADEAEMIASHIRALATTDQIAALATERAKLDKAVEALQGLVRYQKSILADVLTVHSNRGAGASEWMREDDRDFMRDLRAAFEVSAAVLAEIGGA